MKKRKFLQVSSMLAAGSMLPPISPWKADERLKNWAGNIEYSTDKVYEPASLPEVQTLVKKYPKLKGLGTRHCFNRIADSKDHLLSSKNINKVISLDSNARTVTVEGGIKYGELAPYLHEKGFALHNLASLPHISVAGSCTTATHGSGMKLGNLATAVVGLEIVTADGSIVTLSKEKEGDTFNGAVVGLGALGIITKVTLRIEPTYQMDQYVFEHLPLAQLKENFDKIMSAGYSVSLFTDWTQESINEVWIKSRVTEGEKSKEINEFFGAKAATKNMHPIAEISAENCTEQMGIPGPWYERLPHFKMGFTPSSGKELQAEYFVPRTQAVEAMMAVQRMGRQISPHLFISEIRTIDADNLWMSPCYKQPSVAIHFTWKQDWPAVSKLLPVIERELAPFGVRPHWGKLFTIPSKVLASRYEKFTDFKQLIAQYDPKGKFRNQFLSDALYTT
jgi:alditol oxidase